MRYNAEALEKLAEGYEKWLDRQTSLYHRVLAHPYLTETAREYAHHGFARRLNQIVHCLERTFTAIPPEETAPTKTDMMDATAFVQSFTTNVFGAADNVARIWYFEVVQPGANFPREQIGLRPKNHNFRRLLGPELTRSLADADDWFKYLESYRDALAHRIPLYVVPRNLTDDDAERLRTSQAALGEAVRNRDWEAYDNLSAEGDKIGSFEPLIMHSFGEGARPVRFHGQLISDLATLVEIGEGLMSDLSKLTRN